MKLLRTKSSEKALAKGSVKPALNGWNHHPSTGSEHLQTEFATMAANKRQPRVAFLPCWDARGASVCREASFWPSQICPMNTLSALPLAYSCGSWGASCSRFWLCSPLKNGLGLGSPSFWGRWSTQWKAPTVLFAVSVEILKKTRDKEWLS